MSQPDSGGLLRIVVIDDRRDTRRSCEILLGRLGYAVKTAEDGSSGLSLCQAYRPHAVLCDIGLPGGMDGYDFARAVRSDPELSRLFLVAQTGFGSDEDIQKSLAAGFNLHLTKPIDFSQLTGALQQIPTCE